MLELHPRKSTYKVPHHYYFMTDKYFNLPAPCPHPQKVLQIGYLHEDVLTSTQYSVGKFFLSETNFLAFLGQFL